jgi:hypothetical protein
VVIRLRFRSRAGNSPTTSGWGAVHIAIAVPKGLAWAGVRWPRTGPHTVPWRGCQEEVTPAAWGGRADREAEKVACPPGSGVDKCLVAGTDPRVWENPVAVPRQAEEGELGHSQL